MVCLSGMLAFFNLFPAIWLGLVERFNGCMRRKHMRLPVEEDPDLDVDLDQEATTDEDSADQLEVGAEPRNILFTPGQGMTRS